ncbi:UPF0057-domain-containing protein [Microstroma glucosiphilum]|uniref:UPF0057-domain-containing protein n=1 Tax=Pseudomicrostroma glucosiphilum TaxID=1684307 RepID=A0A316U8Y0_9BASI|nr:UPF0057-domain-containing protein [Pseudomicrostroma glucosiphilum]PWN21622.1 UPF0057-domain-containing protein [Pseudomicrostroma glucosiphilum]
MTRASTLFTSPLPTPPTVAIFVPPLGVFLEVGCGASFWINILLTILGYIPGIIHAIYVIFKF